MHKNPYILDVIEANKLAQLTISICLATEWDEFWSYVGNKKEQRWTWYAIDRQSGCILGWRNGRRKDEVLQTLIDDLQDLPITLCHTDDWKAYAKLLPAHWRHCIGKDNTWKIERRNLNFRTHIKRLQRKTICFSKNEQIHDNVISMYIERYYYKPTQFT